MTLAEWLQIANAGGVLVLSWFVLSELRLIRPILQAILVVTGAQLAAERPDVAEQLKKLTPTPPPGTVKFPGDGSS